jgi:hypothetical protein
MGNMFAKDALSTEANRQVSQALLLWLIFFGCLMLLNGTIPFLLGQDLHTWTASASKRFLLSLLIYGGLCFCAPLILAKGWPVVRRPGFLLPCLAALAAISFWSTLRGIAAVVVVVYIFLHWRYDLSSLGFRTRGWRGDLAVLLAVGLVVLAAVLLQSRTTPYNWEKSALGVLDRMFANPASTVENVFYFGFLAERLVEITGRWLTPPLIAGMYTLHEMTNPEYWYGGASFGFIFVGIWLVAALYTWRRSIPVIWLGDGLIRFVFWAG